MQYYANLSDRGVSKAVKRDVLFRYFVGLSIEDEVPDDTTLVKFRSRLGEERFRKLFDRIVKQAQRKGLLKERIKTVDATHITADIATQGLVNPLRQARKMVVRKIQKATNKRPQQLEERYITKEKIYKKPTNEEIEKEINLTKEFINQIEGKVSKGKTRQSEGDLHYFSILDCKSCTNKECLKKNMKRVHVYVSDAYKLRQGVDEEKKKEALLIRKRIEAKFGEAKKWHNLDRARYRGRWKVAIQALMTFLVTNCKRIVKLLKERWKEFLRQLKEWEERLKERGNLQEVKTK